MTPLLKPLGHTPNNHDYPMTKNLRQLSMDHGMALPQNTMAFVRETGGEATMFLPTAYWRVDVVSIADLMADCGSFDMQFCGKSLFFLDISCPSRYACSNQSTSRWREKPMPNSSLHPANGLYADRKVCGSHMPGWRQQGCA
jgi:hypothetical protein